MTLVSTIIYDALRESNIIGESENPSASQEAEALRRLQSIIASVFGNEAGENFVSWPIPDFDTQYLVSNVRAICNLTSALSINLPEMPRDGSRIAVQDLAGNFNTYPLTLDGNGVLIEGVSSIVLNTNDLNREWFFRADLGSWMRTTDLEAADEMPFPVEFDDLFVTMLAIRLNPRYGIATSAETAEALRRVRSQFRSRYRQVTEVSVPIALELINPWYRNKSWIGYSYGPNYFSRGYPF